MNLTEKLTALAQRAPSLIDNLQTEEATKNALVMPFIAALGYDVFNPLEVVPEFIADVGTKKGEKVDYAVMQDEQPIMIFECKQAGANLSDANMSQLFRYFTVSHARIAILTNGVQYWFFSDLEETNKMDTRPFLILDLLNLSDDHVAEIKKLGKDSFDLERMLSAATELKFTREIKKVIQRQIDEPDEEFVRFFFNETNPGVRFMASAKEQFTQFVRAALQQYINERVNSRLRNALHQESARPVQEPDDEATADDVTEADGDNGIVTTAEELEGYHVVKAIVREVVSAERVVHRDTKSYMGILLDDNNRKPICRLRFNWTQKYLGLFDENRDEVKIPIDSIDDIYNHTAELKLAAAQYDG